MFSANDESEAATYHDLSAHVRPEAGITLSPEGDEINELYEEISADISQVSSPGSSDTAMLPGVNSGFPYSHRVSPASPKSMTGLYRVYSWETVSGHLSPRSGVTYSSGSNSRGGDLEMPISPPESTNDDTDWSSNSGSSVPQSLSGAAKPQRELFAIVPVPGKGQGIVATTRIAAGTPILKEVASIRINKPGKEYVPPQTQFDELSEEEQTKVLSLHNTREHMGPLLGVIWTNAIPLRGLYPQCGLFITASRFNHACNPNAMHTWDVQEEALVTYALRNIEEGEEITSKYFRDLARFKQRQDHLRKLFGFTCTCSLCSLDPEARAASDDRIQKINRLECQLESLAASLHRFPMLKKIREVLELYREEGIVGRRPRDAYTLAERVTEKGGDWKRFVVFWARRAALEAIWGEYRDREEEVDKDHAVAYRHLARTEWCHTGGRGGGLWPPAATEEFEDWLFDEQSWLVSQKGQSQAGDDLGLEWSEVGEPAPEEWDLVKNNDDVIRYI